jgi:hypothetical protein
MNSPLRVCTTVWLLWLSAGCGTQVPSPWRELGVPTKGLETVSTVDGKSFDADYTNEDYRVLEAFQDGLKRGGLDLSRRARSPRFAASAGNRSCAWTRAALAPELTAS